MLVRVARPFRATLKGSQRAIQMFLPASFAPLKSTPKIVLNFKCTSLLKTPRPTPQIIPELNANYQRESGESAHREGASSAVCMNRENQPSRRASSSGAPC